MKKQNNNTTTFWVSYADLMAGLLFVFILLIGAIIIKYSLLQSESELLERDLIKEKKALEKSKEELINKEKKIENTINELKDAKKSIFNLTEVINSVKNDLSFSLEENEKLKKLLEDNKKIIQSKQKELLLVQEDLEEKKDKINVFESLKIDNENKINRLNLDKEELIKSLNLVNESEKKKNEEIRDLAAEIVLKEKLIVAFRNKNRLLDDELKVLYEKFKSVESKHNAVIVQLNNTKQKVKNLTGIKIRVISLLKDKLGKKIQIDPKNGAIRLSSNILFEEGKYTLIESSKIDLKNAVYDYFNTILENEDINKHIDKIVIEGHTNSKGSFLYNLELSQKRAYSVMSFLLDLDFDKKQMLKKLVVASGRSFLDPIYINGIEDMDKSRRIEIKFRLKNEEAIKEIESIFE